MGNIFKNPHLIFTVVKQYFEVQVYDVFVMRGNTAIFKCQIPSFVADHVDIIEWTSTDNQTFEHSDDYGLRLEIERKLILVQLSFQLLFPVFFLISFRHTLLIARRDFLTKFLQFFLISIFHF